MIKQFDDNSYVEIKKTNGKVSITVAAADSENPKVVVVNTAEVTSGEFDTLISDVVDKIVAKAPAKKRTTKKKKTAKKISKKTVKKTEKTETKTPDPAD